MPYPVGGSERITRYGNLRLQAKRARYQGDFDEYRKAKVQLQNSKVRKGLRKLSLYQDLDDGTVGYGRYRRRHRRKGRGFYSGFLSDAVGGLGGAVGKGFGMEDVGRQLGSRFGGWLSRKSGWGNYSGNELRAPGGSVMAQNIPQVSNGGENVIRIANREYIGQVISPNSLFQLIYTMRIQPGDPNTFPWLSKIAQNFERYRIHGMIFMFRSTSGSLSTAQALGEVVASFQDNPYSHEPFDKLQMLSNGFGSSGVPSRSQEFPIECHPNQIEADWKYIRGGGVLQSQTSRLDQFDHGKFNLGVVGVPGVNIDLGELWVSYDIELSGTRSETQGEHAGTRSFHLFNNGGGVDTTHPMGTSPVTIYNNIGCSIQVTQPVQVGLYIDFPRQSRGTFILLFQICTVTGQTATPAVTFTGQNMAFNDPRTQFFHDSTLPSGAPTNVVSTIEKSGLVDDTANVLFACVFRMDPTLAVSGAPRLIINGYSGYVVSLNQHIYILETQEDIGNTAFPIS